MTVASATYLTQLAWTGVETTFATGLQVASAADLRVTHIHGVSGVRTLLTITTHYTVSLSPGGIATVTPVSFPVAPGTIEFERNTPSIQPINFEDLATYSAEVHESLHDLAAMRDAETKGVTGRAVMVPAVELGVVIPNIATRANKVLEFDALGNPVTLTTVADIGGSVEDAEAAAAAAAASAATAAGHAAAAQTAETNAETAETAAELAETNAEAAAAAAAASAASITGDVAAAEAAALAAQTAETNAETAETNAEAAQAAAAASAATAAGHVVAAQTAETNAETAESNAEAAQAAAAASAAAALASENAAELAETNAEAAAAEAAGLISIAVAFSKARVVATTNIAIATGLEAGDVIDGVSLIAGDYVLLAGQTAPAQNGVYVVAPSGTGFRRPEMDTYDLIAGSYFSITEGSVMADTLWRCTSNTGGTIDVTALVFAQLVTSGGVSAVGPPVAGEFARWTAPASIEGLTDAEMRTALDLYTTGQVDTLVFSNVASAINNAVYGVAWNGSTTQAPSRDAVYDKIETVVGSIAAVISDAVYGVAWNGVTGVGPSQNAVYDKIEAVVASIAAVISDAVYGVAWNGVTGVGPSQNAVYDKIEAVVASIPAATVLASAAEWRTGTDSTKVLGVANTWGAAAEVALVDGASIAVDLASFLNATVTLGGNRALANPTNDSKAGQSGRIRIIQDGTGSRTLSYGTSWEFAGGTAPVLSTAIGAQDLLYYDVIAPSRVFASLTKAIS